MEHVLLVAPGGVVHAPPGGVVHPAHGGVLPIKTGTFFKLVKPTKKDALEDRSDVEHSGLPQLSAHGFVDINAWGNVCAEGMMPADQFNGRLLPLLLRMRDSLRASPAPAVQPDLLNEDVLVMLFKQLNFELISARRVCRGWKRAAQAVVTDSAWLSRALASRGVVPLRHPAGATVDVDYKLLEAHNTYGPSGFGLRCRRNIASSEVIVEYMGERHDRFLEQNLWAVYPDIATLQEAIRADLAYTVGFYDGVVNRRRMDIDAVHITARTFGNLARFANDNTQTPNAELQWHEPSLNTTPPAPRCYLVALRDIPAGTEITYHYGPDYWRPWEDDADGPRNTPRVKRAKFPQ